MCSVIKKIYKNAAPYRAGSIDTSSGVWKKCGTSDEP